MRTSIDFYILLNNFHRKVNFEIKLHFTVILNFFYSIFKIKALYFFKQTRYIILNQSQTEGSIALMLPDFN